jgi:peptide chain release factor 2
LWQKGIGADLVELDGFRAKLAGFAKPMEQIRVSLDLDDKQKRIQELEASMEAPGFWDDPEKSQVTMKELRGLQSAFEAYKGLEQGIEDANTLIEMAEEENDTSLVPDVENEVTAVENKLEELRIETLLSGEYDKNNAILTLHAGAGGTESCDWCQMLYRMYTRWADANGYSTETLDYLEGEEAGIKSVTVEISGENAYGHLKSEHGVHRLVRISPFNAAGKRQTSFVSCDVMPDIDTNIDIEINDDDLRIDTYRSSGAGGQHINKTSSAIRITHIPTGIVVQCQNERSQHQNKDKAMQMLKARLYLLKQQENAQKSSDIRGDVKDINFGSQIRSYILQPYTMVKDHRTNKDIGNAQSVLDGNLNPLINSYLNWISTGKKEGEE